MGDSRLPEAAGGGARGALRRWLDGVERAGLLSAASVRVALYQRPLFEYAFGVSGATAGSARFDLASLTKPHAATLALELDRAGRLGLETPIGELRPGAAPGLAHRTLGELLRHRGGLQAWVPLYALCQHPPEALERLLAAEWWGARRGTYSDLGYVLWGLLAEQALGQGLERLLRHHVLERCGSRACFDPGPEPGVLPCEMDGSREVELAHTLGLEIEPPPPPRSGRVQDGNARWLGGVSAHAGLFGSVEDLHRLALAWLDPPSDLRTAVPRALAGGGPFALGWARRRVRGSAGRALDSRSFGHTGFTGGSMWWEAAGRRRGAVYLLLGHRRSAAGDLGGLRRGFHHRAAALVDEWLVSGGRTRPSSRPC